MKDKNLKSSLIRWIVPCTIFILLFYFLVLRFSLITKINEQIEVEESMISIAKGYAERIEHEMREMVNISIPLIDYVGAFEDSEESKINMAAVLQENTTAYLVVVGDMNGKGVTHAGGWIDLSVKDYFPSEVINEPIICWSKSDGVQGRECIVAVLPVNSEKEVTGYVIMYYSIEEFSNIIKKMEFDSSAFYAVVDPEGRVICSYGAKHAFLEGDNFWNTILEQGVNQVDVENAIKKRNKGHSGMVTIEMNQEEKNTAISYAPISVNDWTLIVGVNQDYVDTLEKLGWSQTASMLKQLILYLGIFVVVMVAVNIGLKIIDAKKRDELEEKADTDLLTGLNNKIATERKIEDYLLRNPDGRNALFVLDIDNFKKINDTMGHAFGDEVLRTLGREIIAEFRMTDIIGRTGGDEFMIFLKDIKEDNMVYKEGEKIIEFFKKLRVGEYVKYSVTASIGGAVFPDSADSFEALYKAADHALYTAKERGKNQLAFHGEMSEKYQDWVNKR